MHLRQDASDYCLVMSLTLAPRLLPELGRAWQSFGLEALLTFFLMVMIMVIATDTRAVGQAAALAIGAAVAAFALFAGPVSGASMNPARSLGPALVSGV